MLLPFVIALIPLIVATAAQLAPGGSTNSISPYQILPLDVQFHMIASDLNLEPKNTSRFGEIWESPIFFIGTRKYINFEKRLVIGDTVGLAKSGFNRHHPTRVLIHGFLASRHSKINRLLGDAYLKKGKYNVIIVDWSRYAQTLDYFAAKRGIDVVAPKVAKLLEFLVTSGGANLDTIYLIGHSLGAHLAGSAGRALTVGRVKVIVAIDPAMVLYLFNLEDRVSPSDAEYVMSIQTNGGQQGLYEPVGHASFYPNWGRNQPACGLDIFGTCSHFKAIDYFAKSLAGAKSQIVARKCSSFAEILARNCPGIVGPAVMGGDPIDTSFQGVFYVPVN